MTREELLARWAEVLDEAAAAPISGSDSILPDAVRSFARLGVLGAAEAGQRAAGTGRLIMEDIEFADSPLGDRMFEVLNEFIRQGESAPDTR